LINGVFTTLYTPFYLYHKKLIEKVEYPASPISRVSSVSDLTSYTRSDIPQHEERELLNLIELIGMITLRLDDARVTELILPRLLRRVRYPPLKVDLMIITQLVSICALGQPTSYDVILSEFFNVFKRFLKDVPNSNICDTTV
jgi:hypothetical protein